MIDLFVVFAKTTKRPPGNRATLKGRRIETVEKDSCPMEFGRIAF
jgi:hypothetical protein